MLPDCYKIEFCTGLTEMANEQEICQTVEDLLGLELADIILD